MLKNLEIWVTEKCNSRCVFCHWWQSGSGGQEISVEALRALLAGKDFGEVESVQISGGEPMTRPDIGKVVDSIVANLPKLKRLVLATNGSYPRRTVELLREIKRQKNIELMLCVSIEGDRETNKKIRGIDSHDAALSTIKECKKSIAGLATMILTTLTIHNCNLESLAYIKRLATDSGSEFSFRSCYPSVHHRYANKRLGISEKQKEVLADFIDQYCRENDFLTAQARYLRTGEISIMNGCLAGKLFANIRSDGYIYPCINSTRKIGDIRSGIYDNNISDLGRYEPCPCCDEACFYPMYNFGQQR